MYPQTVEELDLYAKPEVFRPLIRIARFLTEEGIPSFLVGGFLRDTLLGRDTADIDIAIDGDALGAAQQMAESLDGHYLLLDSENGIGRVALSNSNIDYDIPKLYIDFSSLRGTIENDLSKRDFTVDAMAIQLDESVDTGFDTKRIIDPFGGLDDIRKKQIRAIDDDVFREDAVRLLRAVRIAAELDFSIYHDTETLIARDCKLISGTAGERIREELLRILALPGAGPRLAYMDRLGLLTAMIPELAPARGVDQPKIHYWDVYDHSIQTVATVEFLLRERSWEYAGEEVLAPIPWTDELKAHFNSLIGNNSKRGSLLKLAAILHDIAKPKTKTIDDDGRARFLGHSQEGASMATKILERLRFSNKEIKYVELLINQHLRPTQMSQEGMPSDRAIYRFFRDTGGSYIDLLFLCLADHLATRGPELDPAQWHEHAKLTKYILNAHREKEILSAPLKLLNGHELIKEFGMQPGPEIGKVLEAVREAQATGEITTRQEATNFVKEFLEKKPRVKPDITGHMEE
jgi:poly(A) polymerase